LDGNEIFGNRHQEAAWHQLIAWSDNMLAYPVTLAQDTNGETVVRFPDFPFAFSAGDDAASALENAREALVLAMEVLMDERKPVPAPSVPQAGGPVVVLPALSASKALLHNAMLASGMRKADLARRLNISLNGVERLLSLRHGSKIEQLETALAALGKRLVVDMLDAA
jgi:antitoxin HicB